jgi:hypothetical protein
MPHAQQVERTAFVVLLCDGRRFMPLYLRHNPDRSFAPLGKRTELRKPCKLVCASPAAVSAWLCASLEMPTLADL